MPLRKSWRRPSALAISALTAAAVTGAGAAPASAASLSTNLTCTAPTLSQPLLRWGDAADYWLMPGGDFESSLPEWSVKNAGIVSGNETLGVIQGSKSLRFGTSTGSSQVTTPEFCVDPLHPTFRFLVKSNSSVSTLNTYINFKTPLGVTLTVTAKLNAMRVGSWTLSESQPLATAIPKSLLGTGVTASITFKAVGSVQMDNLLIDPYRRG